MNRFKAPPSMRAGVRAQVSSRREVPKRAKVSMARVAAASGKVIRREAPTVKAESHWGHPWYVGVDLVCAVGAFAQHGGVEFWRGSTFADPDHLLEGTGKNLRHVKLSTLEEATAPKFTRLVRRAVALDLEQPEKAH